MNLLTLALAHLDDIAAVIALLGGVIWHRGKKIDLKALADRLMAVARQQFPKLLADPHAHAHAHQVVENALWSKLEKLGFKKTAQLDKLVDKIIDHALGELAGKLMERDLGTIGRTLQATADKIRAET